MDRKLVYKIVDNERKYQNSFNTSTWLHGGKPSIEGEILMMEEYLKAARTSWTTGWGDKNAGLEELRKVTAIAIRCFENHGVPDRNTSSTPNSLKTE